MQKTLKFSWNQELPEPNDLAGWRLYSSPAEDGISRMLIAEIPFVAAQTDYTTEQTFEVSEGKLYFFVTSFDTSGNESGLSSPVFEVFDITPPSIPVNFTITVIG